MATFNLFSVKNLSLLLATVALPSVMALSPRNGQRRDPGSPLTVDAFPPSKRIGSGASDDEGVLAPVQFRLRDLPGAVKPLARRKQEAATKALKHRTAATKIQAARRGIAARKPMARLLAALARVEAERQAVRERGLAAFTEEDSQLLLRELARFAETAKGALGGAGPRSVEEEEAAKALCIGLGHLHREVSAALLQTALAVGDYSAWRAAAFANYDFLFRLSAARLQSFEKDGLDYETADCVQHARMLAAVACAGRAQLQLMPADASRRLDCNSEEALVQYDKAEALLPGGVGVEHLIDDAEATGKLVSLKAKPLIQRAESLVRKNKPADAMTALTEALSLLGFSEETVKTAAGAALQKVEKYESRKRSKVGKSDRTEITLEQLSVIGWIETARLCKREGRSGRIAIENAFVALGCVVGANSTQAAVSKALGILLKEGRLTPRGLDKVTYTGLMKIARDCHAEKKPRASEARLFQKRGGVRF